MSTVFSQANLRFGPLPLLGRTILAAEELSRQKGVTLRFATPGEFLDVNIANAATWHGLLALFDHRYNALSQENSFFIFGANATGEVVACQAGVLFDFDGTSFAEEIASLRLFYRDPATMKNAGERVEVSSLAARGTTGRVVYSGGAWYRRDYRGIGLVEWIPRVGRAIARGRWDTRATVTIMAENNVKKTVFPRNGYPNLEWAIDLYNTNAGTARAAYLWSKDEEMLADLEAFLERVAPQGDLGLIATHAKQPR